MRLIRKKLLLTLLTGAIALQFLACDTITAIATSLTAGGVLYLVNRVID